MEPTKIDPILPTRIPSSNVEGQLRESTKPENISRNVMDDKTLRQEAADELERLLQGDFALLDDEEKDKIRNQLIDALNKVINIPIIGEVIERRIIKVLVRAAEVIAAKYTRKLIGDIADKVRG